MTLAAVLVIHHDSLLKRIEALARFSQQIAQAVDKNQQEKGKRVSSNEENDASENKRDDHAGTSLVFIGPLANPIESGYPRGESEIQPHQGIIKTIHSGILPRGGTQ
jgi:hypothetical protein